MKPIACFLAAVILLAAGLGAVKTCVDGLKEHEIMSGGRRISRMVTREKEPSYYWMIFSYHAGTGLALLVCAAWTFRTGVRSYGSTAKR